MFKYDFDLELNYENSLSIIIDLIKPNTNILEFGPANGRLTKHLKEQLNCNITIVEIDEKSGEQAAQYAEQAFVGPDKGDIEKYYWELASENRKFDYVIFADVLEHLYDPESVLDKCKNLLNPGGSIIASIPNIAHNSVLIDLVRDEFEYTQVGLLDNTHIRFFTYHSFKKMSRKLGFLCKQEFATYCKVGENEIRNNYEMISTNLAKELRKRKKGNIYQYVFELGLENGGMKNIERSINTDNQQDYVVACYIKSKDTQEDEQIQCITQFINPAKNKIIFDISEYKDIEELRVDPIDANCIVKINKIYTEIEGTKIEFKIKATNAELNEENLYFFTTSDPQIYIEQNNVSVQELIVEIEFLEYDSDQIKAKIDSNKSNNKIKVLETDVELKANHIGNLETEIELKTNHIGNLETEISLKTNHIFNLETEIKLKANHIANLENIMLAQENQINNLKVLNEEIKNQLSKQLELKEKELQMIGENIFGKIAKKIINNKR